MYHRENAQEGFLVLAGECLLIVEEKERRLTAWDFFHCPGGTEHMIVATGEEAAVVLAVGARGRGVGGGIVYPVSETCSPPRRQRRARDDEARRGVRKGTRRPPEIEVGQVSPGMAARHD